HRDDHPLARVERSRVQHLLDHRVFSQGELQLEASLAADCGTYADFSKRVYNRSGHGTRVEAAHHQREVKAPVHRDSPETPSGSVMRSFCPTVSVKSSGRMARLASHIRQNNVGSPRNWLARLPSLSPCTTVCSWIN